MMNTLRENLGRKVSIKELAEYLGLDIETVRRHYIALGGIRLGRRILFFENLIIEAIREACHAIQEEEKEESGVGSRGDARGEEVLQGLWNESRSPELGSGNKKKALRNLDDPFGLLEAD
jgi:DNA-binding transcriptional ArsR family regulator